jgi:H+/Cl- antiporter ClcA
VLGGVALAALGFASPYALTFGEGQIGVVVGGGLALGALAGAFAAKLAGTITTLATGWKGGFIIPLFFLGATTGEIVHVLAPSANEIVVVAALMAACCVGVTKTPLGSTLVVTGMAGLTLLPTTLVAAVVALVLTDRLAFLEGQRDRVDFLEGPMPVETGDPDGSGSSSGSAAA